ncbi:hypothetical protein Tco_0491656 [Tanacetum coccineum]
MIDSQMDDMIRNRNELKQEIDSLKQTLSKEVKEKESLLQTFTVFKKESKEKERKNMDKEIDLEKKINELDNIKVQLIKPTLYDGIVISKKHDVIYVVDEEETLILEEESRSKMLAKQNDPISKEKKINISPINYNELNKLAEDFGKYFVPQMQVSVEQAFWLDPKDVLIVNLRKHIESLKGKSVVKKDVQLNNPKVIAPGIFKLDLEPLAPRVLNNRVAHIDYIKHSREHADTLREIVKHARALRPLDSELDSTCKIVQRIQEVLVYVKSTCPSLTKHSEKLVVVTLLNKNKKVRFAGTTTSSSNTQKQADSYKAQDSNKLVLPSTGMKSSTSASRSQPSGADIAKIMRKRLKPGKQEHGNRRARKNPGGSYQSQTMVLKFTLAATNIIHKLSLVNTLQDMPHGLVRKHKERDILHSIYTQKKHKKLQTTDCHAGNPCELSSDPTVDKKHPMISI